MKRWRFSGSWIEARDCLESLVAHAVPTRRRTLLGDADVYSTMTDAGDRIHLAVRDHCVVTVFGPFQYGQRRSSGINYEELRADSEATRRECWAMLARDRQPARRDPVACPG
jgi:hypothetical protein